MRRFLVFLIFANFLNAEEDFDVSFDKDGIFNPGDKLSGKFKSLYEGKQKIQKISLDFIGRIHTVNKTKIVGLAAEYKTNSNTSIDIFRETKEIFSGTTIPKSINFSFKLPKNLPFSVELYGNFIEYSVVPRIIFDNGKIHKLSEFIYTVNGGIDLSKDSGKYEKPVKCEHKISLGIITATPFKMIVSLPKNGYVSGEVIDISLKFEGETKYKLDEATFEVWYRPSMITKKGLNNTMKLTDAPLNPTDKNVDVYSNSYPAIYYIYNNNDGLEFSKLPKSFKLEKRTLTPTILRGSGQPLMSAEYVLSTEVRISRGFGADRLKCEIPVTIGVVPTKNSKMNKTPALYEFQPQGYEFQSQGGSVGQIRYPFFEPLK